MATLDVPTTFPSKSLSKPIPSRRSYAGSVKAIMHSRHANTRRNMKRRATEPWIGEIIVVKEYDQMDSLREILELPARIQRTTAEVNESEAVEQVETEETEREVSELKSTPSQSTTGTEQGIKRKREEEKEDDDEAIIPSVQNLKRKRVMSPGSLCHQQTHSPETRRETAKVFDMRKENISQVEVLHLTVTIKDAE